MFREEYKARYDQVVPSDAFQRRLEERLAHKKRIRPVRLVAVLAALLLALAAVGAAAGVFDSLFGRMERDGFAGMPDTDYSELERRSDRAMQTQNAKFEGGERAELSLEQSYYNGEQLMLGWTCRALDAPRFLEVDAPELSKLKPTSGTSEGGDYYVAVNLEAQLDAQTFAEFQRRLKENGWAAVEWTDAYMGDGVWIEGVPSETENAWTGETERFEDTRIGMASRRDWEDEGVMRVYEEAETPLPDAARDGELLTLTRKLYVQRRWYRVDETGEYFGEDDAQSETLRFTVQRNDEYQDRSFSVHADRENYSVDFELTATPVNARLCVRQQSCAQWRAAYASCDGKLHWPLNLPEDLVYDYEIWSDDGDTQTMLCEELPLDSCEGLLENAEGSFVLPENARSLIFRPIRANSGPDASEDVTLALGSE